VTNQSQDLRLVSPDTRIRLLTSACLRPGPNTHLSRQYRVCYVSHPAIATHTVAPPARRYSLLTTFQQALQTTQSKLRKRFYSITGIQIRHIYVNTTSIEFSQRNRLLVLHCPTKRQFAKSPPGLTRPTSPFDVTKQPIWTTIRHWASWVKVSSCQETTSEPVMTLLQRNIWRSLQSPRSPQLGAHRRPQDDPPRGRRRGNPQHCHSRNLSAAGTGSPKYRSPAQHRTLR
jgi:hypothetical protein